MSKRFDALTKAQQDALGLIAMNRDSGHHPRVLAALLKRGLIEERKEVLFPLSRFPIKVKRYEMPLAEHVRWCAWCAENVPDEAPAGGSDPRGVGMGTPVSPAQSEARK